MHEHEGSVGGIERQWFDKYLAADYLCTIPEGIKGEVRRGKLRPCRRSPRWLFSRDELDAYARGEL